MRQPIRLLPLFLPAILACVLRSSPAAGQAGGLEFRVNTYTTDRQQRPRIATDPGGNFVVVWESRYQDGSYYGVFGQRYSLAGLPLGPEFRVNTYTTNRQAYPSVASDSGGNFVVVWQSLTQDGSTYGVFGQRYVSTGAPLGAEFRVNSFTGNDQGAPSVTSDSGGAFVVAWESSYQDGSSDGVFGRRYDSMGAPLGGDFQVNSYTTGVQRYPSVTSDSNGHFVVVWRSTLQDGSSYGVFGQRFCPVLTLVAIAVNGATAVCSTSTAGTATVTDEGGGVRTHQWGFRTVSGSPFITPIAQTGTSYTIDGASFPGAGTYFLVCGTTPECGTLQVSNEIAVTVTCCAADVTTPAVTPPSFLATTQTICM